MDTRENSKKILIIINVMKKITTGRLQVQVCSFDDKSD